ncbi:cellulose synthase like G1 [Actinidia rufa]|uniref:Cellulose synthase like G1 n=1 Tax=Actinidia rufa TaxID=165716 RepID=A0A7J0DNX9_9ERIC|nr:cellulose synthase like G1 [Actinidia rufa]
MYESMKMRVEKVVERGSVPSEYITDEQQHQTFSKWTAGFTNQDHPTVLQVLLESGKDKDIKGQPMPNLIYIAREKSSTTHHNFKAGALNVLIRVSAAMTNSPIIPDSRLRHVLERPTNPASCYVFSLGLLPQTRRLHTFSSPQIFHGLNKHDIYCGEFKYIFQINPAGMDGVGGPPHVGTGCFFRRRALFGGPTSLVVPENPKLGPDHRVTGPIQSKEVLSLAHQVAGCNFEAKTVWGYKGKRYEQGIFDFGVASPMYLPLTMGAFINLIALVRGICQVYFNGGFEDLFLQLFLAGFGVIK